MKCIITYSAGCSYVGILMNIIRYISLYSFTSGDTDSNLIKTTLLFFLIAAVVMLVCLLLFLFAYTKKDFIVILSKAGEIAPNVKNQEQLVDDNIVVPQKEGISLSVFIEAVKAVLSINLLMATIYVVNFMFYPSSLIFLKFLYVHPHI